MNQKILQKLARSNKYQVLYNRAKELGTLKLFYNTDSLTKVQMWFLYFLEVYSSLYLDLAIGKEYISDEVIEDDLRMEAYLLYRQENRKKESKEYSVDKKLKIATDIPTVVFKRE